MSHERVEIGQVSSSLYVRMIYEERIECGVVEIELKKERNQVMMMLVELIEMVED